MTKGIIYPAVVHVNVCRLQGAAIVLCLVSTAPSRVAGSDQSTKSESVFYGAQTRANVKANTGRYEWARSERRAAIAEAKPWVEMSDHELWEMIVAPKLTRAIMVNVGKGCPNCGMAIYGERGASPWVWNAWVEGHPWKVQCPNCKELFPKNDFSAFYRSGIDSRTGLFDPDGADHTLLFNAEHPDPTDPKHKHCVDDGKGWRRFGEELGQRDWYVGYHVYIGRMERVMTAIRSLATAYSLTGKPIYAHKCVILLDRLADVYPDYDGKDEQYFHNPWERYSEGFMGPAYKSAIICAELARSYDMIFEGMDSMPETLAFIQAKAHRYKVSLPKNSIADIRRNIEQRILIFTGLFPERLKCNGTTTELSLALVDLVLRGEAAKREFLAKHMPLIAPQRHLNNDGSGNERSTQYDSGMFRYYCKFIADLYRLDQELTRDVLEAYPNLRASFDFWPDIWCLEKYIPLIGDAGHPGATSRLRGVPEAYLGLIDMSGNKRYAQVAMRMVGGDSANLPRDIYATDPEGVVERVVQADVQAGEWATPSVVKPDYCLAILRSGQGKGRHALWFYYSPEMGTSSHSQYDALTFGLYAHGLSMVCEQGYPLYTGHYPSRHEWTSHTRSHATVTVDGRPQKYCEGGTLLAFAEADGVSMVAAEAPCAYRNVSRYRRTLALIEVSPNETFAVDVFRVRGGREHFYTVPMFYGTTVTHGLALSARDDLYDGYVTKVEASVAESPWYVDTAIRSEKDDDVAQNQEGMFHTKFVDSSNLAAWKGHARSHLRVHGVPSEAKVMIGEGETKWGKEDQRRLPYIVLHRQNEGGDLDSTFLTVYEPYEERPFLAEHPVTATVTGFSVSVDVQLVNGQDGYTLIIEDDVPSNVIVHVKRRRDGKEEQFTLH